MSEEDNEFDIGKFVSRRIHQMLGDDPNDLTPWGRAMLAQLRQAAGKEPGTVPAIWAVTEEKVPSRGEGWDARTESAIHLALTQFAIHQQGRSTSMHKAGLPFGRAIRKLAEAKAGGGEVYESPVYRRFSAMATATHIDGLTTHARGLVTQLRGEDIPFDYHRYARDLYWFQVPGRAPAVRRGWGRDFHYLTTNSPESTEGVSE